MNRASEVKFAERLKRHLESWARDVEQFRDDGDHPWVLDRSVSALNYFGGRDWEAVLSGQLHTWGHALNSSQAFAVNLFGPARFSKAVARALWNTLPAAGDGPGPDRVDVHFEYSGPDKAFAKAELGEAGKPTQIDVAIEGMFPGGVRQMQFIEVKLSESKFGSCRGAKRGKNAPNPAPDRCRNLSEILENPGKQCWLTDVEGRRYWQVIGRATSGMNMKADERGGCPWQGGLYQLMRNWALARAMLDRGLAARINLAVCVHPSNHAAIALTTEVAGADSVVDAFNALTGPMTVSKLDVVEVIKVQHAAGAPKEWRSYMQRRYLIPPAPSGVS